MKTQQVVEVKPVLTSYEVLQQGFPTIIMVLIVFGSFLWGVSKLPKSDYKEDENDRIM